MPEIIESPETINLTAAQDIVFSTNGVERARIHEDGTGAGLFSGSIPQTGVKLSAGPADPTTLNPGVPSGDEYVWIETDGNGGLVDIIVGKAA